MKEENKSVIVTIIANILALSLFIFNIIALIHYYNHDLSLLTICGVLNIIYFILLADGRNLVYIIILCIGSYFVTKDIWYGICYGLSLSNIFSSIFGIILTIYHAISIKKYSTKKD